MKLIINQKNLSTLGIFIAYINDIIMKAIKAIKASIICVFHFMYFISLLGCKGLGGLDGVWPPPKFEKGPHIFGKNGGEKIITAENDVAWRFSEIYINGVRSSDTI